MESPALVPQPVSIEQGEGSFALRADTVLVTDEASASTAAQLAALIQSVTSLDLVTTSSADHDGTVIALAQLDDMEDLGAEGYRLDVTPQRVTLTAATQAGLFYAIQTFRQLLSTCCTKHVEWRIPCLKITDYPRFEWRGLMLDTGHDFQHVPFILRFIDLMALHKFNVLQWHITDLGTFPLEITNYPRLQDQATLGTRMRGEPKRPVKPGHYTQAEVRDIVKYAAARHITIVPEIDMPGHSTPALIAYPEFDCPVPHKFGEMDRWEYCVGSEKTYGFLQDVLSQVIDLFPSQYIHIGGDECPKDHWKKCPVCQAKMKAEKLQNEDELQSYFVRRIEEFLNSRGRCLIGWDEILEGGLAPNAVVMAWRPEQQAATIAAKAGHGVVMALRSHLYFDYPESTTPLEKVYGFDPVPEGLTPEQSAHILGVQAQMWTDDHPTEKEIERLLYPRACAVCEVAWSPARSRYYSGFLKRLSVHANRLAALGIHFEVS